MLGSFVKVSKKVTKKCQKSWFSGNGSARRAVTAFSKVKYQQIFVRGISVLTSVPLLSLLLIS